MDNYFLDIQYLLNRSVILSCILNRTGYYTRKYDSFSIFFLFLVAFNNLGYIKRIFFYNNKVLYFYTYLMYDNLYFGSPFHTGNN